MATGERDRFIVPEIVTVPSGPFWMGSEDGQDNERPVHEVHVSGFGIARVPVTNREYGLFLADTAVPLPKGWQAPRFADPHQPVVGVSWFDAAAYCAWLSAQTQEPYRLPTEAEREKAARGGFEGNRFPWGDEMPEWMEPVGRGAAHERPDRVGQDRPNGYGLHNMGDLVHEWCADWYDAEFYARSPTQDPVGADRGERRASRGGSWRHRIRVTRCAARSSLPPDRRFTDYGFRLARSL